jgi:hypothetical protein
MENNKNMGWVKNLLNNLILLRFVKKYSADNLFDDNSKAESFGVKCNESSISVGDKNMLKMLVTQARYNGKEFVRYNIKQLKEVFDFVGDEGELIVSAENNNELFVQVKDSVVIVSPLPKSDTKK